MSTFLFKEFDEVSAKQWKQKIQVDLKGANYNDALIWQSLEGIHVKPFYHEEDAPDGFPPIPGHPHSWNIAQSFFIDDEGITNSLVLDAIERGAEAIYLEAQQEFQVEKVFANFPFRNVPIHFNFGFLDSIFIQNLINFFSEKGAVVFYHIDLIGHLAREGNWFQTLKKDHEILEVLVEKNPSEALVSIDTGLYQNAGANCVQQLAYGLAHAHEYLHHFGSALQTSLLTFKVAVGSNYFFEIAKIRALRKLYAVLAAEYKLDPKCHILVSPSKRNKTIYDYNINMLRTTTECMSAILGGADTVCNLAYDSLYHKNNEFGERIARNQLLILKAESYFDTVSNPADGSYYIESLTSELAEKALVLFKEIERNGGFVKQLTAGTIQKKIKESAQKEQALFDNEQLILLGTNKHQNPKDRMKEDLELYPFVKVKPRKTLLEPIIEKRISEKNEQDRLAHE